MAKKRKFKSLQELFRAKSRWSQGAAWRNKRGEPTRVKSSAVSFCLVGGVSYVYSLSEQDFVLNKLRTTIHHYYLTTYNDDSARTIGDIRALVKKAGV